MCETHIGQFKNFKKDLRDLIKRDIPHKSVGCLQTQLQSDFFPWNLTG